MRRLLILIATLLLPAMAAAAPVPLGRLPADARPVAYRLALTIDPARPRFSGHAEIDIDAAHPLASLYIHGRALNVTRIVATLADGHAVGAKWSDVDPSGVARLDFATPLPTGRATLAFDYDAAFADGPAGLFHLKVGADWYAWTQFESIDARAAFPSFDEPGFKTPFAVTLTTPAGVAAISNGPETATAKVGAMVRHDYAATPPLPTYLVAFAVGPFDIVAGAVPPTPQRATPLPLRIVGTKGLKPRLAFALAETPRIVTLLEKYFDRPFPFAKLDMIASPILPGAMENAGAVMFDDNIVALAPDAPTGQRQEFGMVVSHELSHQWFGDLVTPAWWDDIWLNESFANWMGFRIGNEWRPELNIAVGALDEGLSAMSTDALEVGRPIRQPIPTSAEADSAFDAITYGKGGQVVDMIASYMGDERFQKGVRLHIARHAGGNASSDDFFSAMADGAGDPRIVAAMRSFVDQQGVPVIDARRVAGGIAVTQRRYRLLGATGADTRWAIPLCLRVGTARDCRLLDTPGAVVPLGGGGPLMPDAGGHGYYRFTLSPADWSALLATAPTLPPYEALTASDSLWAGWRAGTVPTSALLDAARRFAGSDESNVATDGGERLAGLRARGMIPTAALPGYRRFMAGVYAPRLAALGLDLHRGAYAAEAPDRQSLRQSLVGLVADEARLAPPRAQLARAADAYLAGDRTALDDAWLGMALSVRVQDGGRSAAALLARALASDDPLFRHAALDAVAGSGDPATARWLLGRFAAPGVRPTDRLGFIAWMMHEPTTRDIALPWLYSNFTKLAMDNNLAGVGTMAAAPGLYCTTNMADEIAARLRPQVVALGRDLLTFDRTVEAVRRCGVLATARGGEIAAALAR